MREWFFDPARSSGQGRPANGLGTERNIVRPALATEIYNWFVPWGNITYVDSANPNTNYASATSSKPLYLDQTAAEKRVIIKWAQAFSTKRFALVTSYGAGASGWRNRNVNTAAVTAIDISFNINVAHIANFNARTIEDLTWNNQGDLTTGSAITYKYAHARYAGTSTQLGQLILEGEATGTGTTAFRGGVVSGSSLGCLIKYITPYTPAPNVEWDLEFSLSGLAAGIDAARLGVAVLPFD